MLNFLARRKRSNYLSRVMDLKISYEFNQSGKGQPDISLASNEF